jgi:hypothetical protein
MANRGIVVCWIHHRAQRKLDRSALAEDLHRQHHEKRG